MVDIKRQENANNRDKISHCQCFHLRLALNHGSTDSLILQCMSDRPDANISKFVVKTLFIAISETFKYNIHRAIQEAYLIKRKDNKSYTEDLVIYEPAIDGHNILLTGRF